MTDKVTDREGGRPAPAPAPDETPAAARPSEPEAEAPEAADVAAEAAAAARDGEVIDGEPAAPAEPPAGEPVDEAEIKAAEYLALAQRTQADFDNYRKRVARDSALAADRATGRLVKELLPALDHLDLALRHAEEEAAGSEPGELLNGIRLVQSELQGALARQGVEAFSPEGEPFDPTEHEAMAQQPVEGAEPGTVALVYQQGYRVNGAVLRPARVVVAA